MTMGLQQLSRRIRGALALLRNSMSVRAKTAYARCHRMILPASVPQSACGALNLHLGCGKINHDKFINIDAHPFPHVHYVQSIAKLPQFKEGSVDLVYASHCLEHFSYLQTKPVLLEWCRVLKHGAILRLSVPDFDKLVEIYRIHEFDPDVILPQLMGGQNNRFNYHLTAFNSVNLSRLLLEAGFSYVRTWEPGSEDLTSFDDFSTYQKEVAGNFYAISLNIEAVK